MSESDWAAFNDAAHDFYQTLNLHQCRITQAREAMEALEAATHFISPAEATRQLEALVAQYRGEQ